MGSLCEDSVNTKENKQFQNNGVGEKITFLVFS